MAAYDLYTANHQPNRDPVTWTFGAYREGAAEPAGDGEPVGEGEDAGAARALDGVGKGAQGAAPGGVRSPRPAA